MTVLKQNERLDVVRMIRERWQGPLSFNPVLLASTLGVLSIALGASVILGWYSGATVLIQVHPSFVPMQFNTALGFLLAGIGLVLCRRGGRTIAVGTGALTALLGGLTLIEYIADVDIGLDQLFMEHYITVETSHPGRMAPNTALCFTLSGLVQILLGLPLSATRRFLASNLIGSLVFGLGILSLIGYFADIQPAYGWSSFTKMAVHTAVGFVLLGSGFVSVGWHITSQSRAQARAQAGAQAGDRAGDRASDQADDQALHRSVAPVLVSLIVVVVGLWQALVQLEALHTKHTIESEVQHLKFDIETILEEQFLALERMAQRWVLRGSTPQDEWRADAQAYVQHEENYIAIEVLHANAAERWTAPDSASAQTEALHGLLENTPEFTDAAPTSRALTLLKLSPLPDQTTAFAAIIPLYVHDRLDGYLVGFFDVERSFWKGAWETLELGYAVTILDEGGIVVSLGDPDPDAPEHLTAAAELKVRNETWRVSIQPSDALRASLNSPLPEIALTTGMMVTLLSIFALYFAQTASHRSKTIAKAYRDLEKVNTDLDQFAYAASHDLKAPMRGIRQLASWVLDDTKEEINERSRSHLLRLVGRVERLQTLLESLLSYARIGRKDAVIEAVNLEQSIADTVALLSVPPAFEVEFVGPDRIFRLDRTAFELIAMNLISNAVKHHDRPNGRIMVSAHGTGQDMYKFSFSDDGPGIPPEYHERIFGMFQTLRPRDEVEGSGMGLALVQKSIEHVGGSVTIISDPDLMRGTTIALQWPKDAKNVGKRSDPVDC